MTTNEILATALPCPFCKKSGVRVMEGSTFRWYVVKCNNCDAACGESRRRTTAPLDEEADVITAVAEWNRRE